MATLCINIDHVATLREAPRLKVLIPEGLGPAVLDTPANIQTVRYEPEAPCRALVP